MGKFERNANFLLEQLIWLGTNRTNAQLAEDMESSKAQISNYLMYLKDRGLIQVRITHARLGGQFMTFRKIYIPKEATN